MENNPIYMESMLSLLRCIKAFAAQCPPRDPRLLASRLDSLLPNLRNTAAETTYINATDAEDHNYIHPDDTFSSDMTDFEPYINPEEIEAGVTSGTIITGALKISREDTSLAYTKSIYRSGNIVIYGKANRNRACRGDIVAVRLFHPVEPDTHGYYGGEVVGILERKMSYRGYITMLMTEPPNSDDNTEAACRYGWFKPVDVRAPCMQIFHEDLPRIGEGANEQYYQYNLCYVEVIRWRRCDRFPIGRFIHAAN